MTATTSNKSFYIIAILGLFTAISISLAALPKTRQWLQFQFFKNKREVIAKLETSLQDGGAVFNIYKIVQGRTLIVEVYSSESGQLLLKEELPGLVEGQMMIQNNVTSLAVSDIDSDGVQEILVPTFDTQLAVQLLVYKYDATLNSIYRLENSGN